MSRYGTAQDQARAAALASLAPGTRCPRCGWPMYATWQEARGSRLPRKLWHLDLGHWPGLAHGGPQQLRLEHAYCNRRAGQATAAARRRRALPPLRPRQRRPVTAARRRARW